MSFGKATVATIQHGALGVRRRALAGAGRAWLGRLRSRRWASVRAGSARQADVSWRGAQGARGVQASGRNGRRRTHRRQAAGVAAARGRRRHGRAGRWA